MRRLVAVALLAVCVAAPLARAANQPPPGLQAAIDACKAKGIKGGTPEFNACVNQQLAPPPLPPGQQAIFDACKAKGLNPGSADFNDCVKTGSQKQSPPPTDRMKAAVAACKAKGLTENTPAFQECLKDETSTGPDVKPSDQAAMEACKASGIAQRTDAFKACVAAASAAASISGWSGEQLAAYNVCKAAGNAFPSAAFAACLSKVLTKLIPDKPKSAQKEVGDVLAACQKQKLVGTAFQTCVKNGLNGG